MKNFIFKSDADFHKIVFNKLETLLAEQRHQRADLSSLIRMMQMLINDDNLQTQVDDYFKEDEKHDIQEVQGQATK